MNNIYIDESGNTGQDLLNPDQLVFVLASNNFSSDEIKTLLSGLDTSQELHFKKLKNSSKGRNSIIKLLNHELITEKNIQLCIAHKEFCTVAQIVDQLVEPVLYSRGIDIYQYGRNIAISNSLYWLGKFQWGENVFQGILSAFVKFMRSKSRTDIEHFFKLVNDLFESLKSEEKLLIEPIIESQGQIQSILETVNKYTIDLTLSNFYVLCDKWYRKINMKLTILHDDSTQIKFYKDYIAFTQTLIAPKQDVGYGSRTLIFPTQIEELKLVDSRNEIGVQLSDLIASSIGFMYSNTNPKQSPFVKEIQDSRLMKLKNSHAIWPDIKVTPEELDMSDSKGKNILDFLASHM